MYRSLSSLLLFVWLLATCTGEDALESRVTSLLSKRCLECHNDREAKGGLNLATGESLLQGGDSGDAIVLGRPQESLLIERVSNGEMPPEVHGKSQPLSELEVQALKEWIQYGAKWPAGRVLDLFENTTDLRAGRDWWSFQPTRRPVIPRIKGNMQPANPVDAFVLSRLQAAGLDPAPPADRATLIRRAYFDLLGLPPTKAEIDSFVQDESADAYELLIDRLLASKHYGERWARHWLDVVRFAETCGYERDQLKPNIWRYRDWVIKAFNDDMPYDQFVTWQLAGDEIDRPSEQSVIATGMIRAGTWNDEPNDPQDYLYERLEDMVHATTSAFIGLTVKCARCHDHKFDPIKQTDYYRTASLFWAGYTGQANLGGPNAEQLGYDVFGWTDRSSKVPPIRLLMQGERHQPAEVVEPGFLSSIPFLDRPFDPPPAGSKTTLRRRQFATWVTNRENPLTARVLVNRLWLYHFGEGIVRTPNNFGFKSDPPTHPDLLDWLATEFIDGGWKIKPLHKLIMTSATYRQASVHPAHEQYSQQDFGNRLWWRFNRRRLDAESLRDAVLAVCGTLNREFGGPSFYPRMSAEALEGLSRKGNEWQESSLRQRSRRSVYMMTKRQRILPLMTAFDFCDSTRPCGKRDVTTVAPQALAMLNNHFVHTQSEALARRIGAKANNRHEKQIELAWQYVLGRRPDEGETRMAVEHLEVQRKRFDSWRSRGRSTTTKEAGLDVKQGMTLWLRADRGVEVDDQGRVMFWRDGASRGEPKAYLHDASQADPAARPLLVEDAVGRRPVVRFVGDGQFMHLVGQVITSPQFSIFAVVSDRGNKEGAREVISNWNARGRSTTSVFLGTRGRTGVRFTDAFSQAGELTNPADPFVLSAVTSSTSSTTYQGRRRLAASGPLAVRDLAAPYVIGTQGNYGREWWHGDVAEVLVYDQALDESDRKRVWRYLESRYEMKTVDPPKPQHLALASLCHVLLNTNEFLYVD